MAMRSILIGGLFVLFHAMTACSADEIGFGIDQDVHVVSTDHISVYEAWNSADRSLIKSADSIAMLYVMDTEAAPSEAGQQLLAIVMVGQAGTGIEPVAFRISASNARAVRLVVGQKGSFELFVGNGKAVHLDVQESGRVTLAGHTIGTIR
jgi:hypothetical protein